MRAAVVHGPGDVRVEDRPVPCPTGREALVEVSHCGVCGTDLHMALEGWARPGTVGGHEWSGRVRAVGEDVRGVAVGDAVVGGPPPGCDACPWCREGRPSLCVNRATPGRAEPDGAFATYVCADERALVPVPAGLALRTAALAEPLAVALHAVSRSGAGPGSRVLVTGAGPIGALVVAASRARGVTEIVVSEPHAGRRALARTVGATEVVGPDDLDVPSMAEPRRTVARPVDAAIECSGRPQAAEAACAQLAPGGRLVLVGSGLAPLRLDPNRVLLNELEVTGAFEYDKGGPAEALALLATGGLDVGHLVEPDDVDLDDLLAALRGLATGAIAGKVLVVPRRSDVRPGTEGRP